MSRNMTGFGAWLQAEIDKRGWTKSMMARKANVSPAAISDVINGRRGVGPELATAIAHALKLPPEHVFTVAGILKQRNAKKDRDPRIDEIMHRAEQLDDLADMLERGEPAKNNRLLRDIVSGVVVGDGAYKFLWR